MDPLDPRDLPPVPTPQARRTRANREAHFDKARRSRATARQPRRRADG